MAHFVIMGCGRVGATLAHTLEDDGHSVAVIDRDPAAFRRLRPGFAGSTVTGVGFDRDTLMEARITEAYAFAAVSSGPNSNLRAPRVARELFHVAHVVARIYDPGRAEIYQRLGIPTVASVRWSADQVLRRILPEHALSGDFREASGRLVLRELPVAPSWVGRPLSQLERIVGVRVAFLTRFGEGILPSEETRYQEGDELHAMLAVDRSVQIDRLLAVTPERAAALRAEQEEEEL